MQFYSYRSTGHSIPFIAAILCFVMSMLANPATSPAQSNHVPSEYVKNFFGAVHLGTEHHKFADDVGASWGRVGITWDKHEPTRDHYDFASYDSLINSAKQNNIEILPVINHSAPWASSAPDSVTSYRQMYPPAASHTVDWKEYVEKVVTRYPDVEYFEIWNEPNIDWFLRAKSNYKVYVDSILIPAAQVIHKHDRKVVGLSFTTEWPLDSWPAKNRPRQHSENVASNVKAVNQWLSYHDAWKYIDIVSVHYTHGDAKKPSYAHAGNMMPFFDSLYTKWIKPGKIEGIWNTEEGFAGTEAGMQGFVGLDRWETEPLAQWAPRYTIPVLHWGIQHDWKFPDQYKVFWYHMKAGDHPRNLLNIKEGNLIPSPTARALKTTRDLLTSGSPISIYPHEIRTGYGIHSQDTSAINYFAPYEFTNYGFKVGKKLVIATWMDLPAAGDFEPPLQATVNGLIPDVTYTIERVGYKSGATEVRNQVRSDSTGKLTFTIPSTSDPIVYLKIH